MNELGYLHWCGFLDDDLIALARNTVIDNRQRFIATTVTTKVQGYRKSHVLWNRDFKPLYDRFTKRLCDLLPEIRQTFLQLPEKPDIELQLTMSGDGEFFKRHTDNGCAATKMRVITYVYYFAMEDERRFDDGQLILETKAGAYTIEPNHNTIIIFPSEWMHEIVPVKVPSQRWEDSRITLNGWICKPNEGC